MGVRSARPPARWEQAQAAFQRAYADDPAAFERHPVRVAWWTVRNDRSGGKLRRIGRGLAVALAKGTAAQWFDGTYAAVFAADAAPGSYADLVIEVPPIAFPEPEGTAEATLVGEYLLNGACALDVGGEGLAFAKAPPFVKRSGVPVAS